VGYKLQATHAWVRHVNQALALGLKALAVISLVTPLPLPGLGMLADYLPTASLDALICYAEDGSETFEGSGDGRQPAHKVWGSCQTPPPLLAPLLLTRLLRLALCAWI
jgi:hypothetical protein